MSLYIQKLDWKSFTVNTRDGGLFETFCKAQSPLCCGLGSNSGLEVYYTDTPDQSVLDAVQAKWDSITETSPEVLEVVVGQQKEVLEKRMGDMKALCEKVALDFKTGNATLLMAEPAGTDILAIKTTLFNKTKNILDAVKSEDVDLVLAALKAVPSSDYDAKYITEERLLSFANQIRAFHGLPAVTALADA